MYEHKMESDIRCPLEYGLKLFGGKWKSRIICILGFKKSLRFGEIKTELSNISDAVLSATLKELITDDIILRISYNEIPPHVEYSLTEKGESIIPILQNICVWSNVFYREGTSNTMTQCQRCDHKD